MCIRDSNINNLEQTVGLFRGNVGKTKTNDDPYDAARSAPFILSLIHISSKRGRVSVSH